MDDAQKKYYKDMLAQDRGVLIIQDKKLAGVVTFFVGDDDEKFLLYHTPWTIIDDDPNGTTLYIDQFLAYKGRSMMSKIHREFTLGLQELKKKFPNITKVKWIRVGAQFRKHGKIEGVTHGRRIHSKDIKP
jgi:hypothetical protein